MIGNVLRVRYEITQSVGETPLFQVFAARDQVQGREVSVRVLKEPFAGEQEFLDRLADVVRMSGTVHHPGIERMFEVDGDDGTRFLVGEPVRGTPLPERLRKLASFSVPVSVATAISICEALQGLHSTGIVHGDVGGHNITMVTDSEVRLQLPGIWNAFASSQTAGVQMLPLMAPYLAPEISRGSMPTPASDVYAVGVLLYEMLTGREPYRADTIVALALKHATDPVPSVRALNPSVPLVLDEIVKKAMSKDREDRYTSAGDMLSDLRILQDALRFGRSLSWPIQGGKVKEAPKVAPVMSAAAPAEKPKPKAKEKPQEPRLGDRWIEEEDEGDVPTWIKMGIAFLAGLIFFMVIGFIVINVSKPREVTLPDLTRLTVSEAQSQLDKLNLDLRIRNRQTSEEVPAEHILEMNPTAGEKVYENSPVSVVVSSGSKFVEVPDIRGLSMDKAAAVLGSVQLRLDENVERVPDDEMAVGLILSQIPEARKSVQRETAVRVKVSSGKRGERTETSNQKYVYSISIRLSDIEEGVNLRVEMTDNRGTKTIHEDWHEPYEEISVTAEGYGPEVLFRIFYNGELVKQVPQKAEDLE